MPAARPQLLGMSSPSLPSAQSDAAGARLATVIALARILERVERGEPSLDAVQYQVLVERLKAALSADLPPEALTAVLGAYPAAAELYENLHYAHAGLSRAPLERSIATEQAAAQLLARISRASRQA